MPVVLHARWPSKPELRSADLISRVALTVFGFSTCMLALVVCSAGWFNGVFGLTVFALSVYSRRGECYFLQCGVCPKSALKFCVM